MKLPAPADLTADDRADVARIVAQADGLADQILSVEVPPIGVYRALHGLVAWGNGSRLFTPSVKHQQALRRLPPEAAMRAWIAQERRLAAMRGA